MAELRGSTSSITPSKPHSPTLLDQLRAATRFEHTALENRLNEVGAGWRDRRYEYLLRMSLGSLAGVESAIVERLGNLFAAPPPATRTERLVADLVALSGDVPPLSRTARPLTTAEAFGTAYVFQGSLLGGAVIRRHLNREFTSEAPPTAYLSMYGDRLPQAWRDYCDGLRTFDAAACRAEHAATVRAALTTFRQFRHELEVLLVRPPPTHREGAAIP